MRKTTELERSELALAGKYSSPDVYINGETDTCWHPWINNLEVNPLRFETRTGTFVVVLRSLEDTWLGKHRHRGSVTAVTLKGEWYYKGYDSCFICLGFSFSKNAFGMYAVLTITKYD